MTSRIVEQSASRRLAIIVVIFNMQCEAPRTLYSLSADYQLDVRSGDYDVIVVENGSAEPMALEEVEQFGSNFHYIRIDIDKASPSPAAAINIGVSRTKAQFVGIMIDGARMASPGIVSLALKTLENYDRPIVGTLAFHLGSDIQPRSILHGYNREVEDELLTSIDWRQNGYRLFDISTVADSSSRGRFGKIAKYLSAPSRYRARGLLGGLAELLRAIAGISESNLLFLPKALFEEMGGYDERYNLPGGGLVNLDFYRRACDLPNTSLITLYREATFHQIHGGTMTNKSEEEGAKEIAGYHDQHRKIRGMPFKYSTRVAMVIGLPKRDHPGDHVETSQMQCYFNPESLKIRAVLFINCGLKQFKDWMRSLFKKGR